jgi:hypothetical protein
LYAFQRSLTPSSEDHSIGRAPSCVTPAFSRSAYRLASHKSMHQLGFPPATIGCASTSLITEWFSCRQLISTRCAPFAFMHKWTVPRRLVPKPKPNAVKQLLLSVLATWSAIDEDERCCFGSSPCRWCSTRHLIVSLHLRFPTHR